jgi:integrase
MNDETLLLTHKTNKSPNPRPNKTVKERKRNSNDPLTKHEVEQLLSKVDNLKDYTLLLFGFSSGVRVGELSFDYNSINWQEGIVSVWDEKKDRYRKEFFDISKKTAERIIQKWTSQILDNQSHGIA